MEVNLDRGFDSNRFVSQAHIYEAVRSIGAEVIAMVYAEIHSFEESDEPGRVDA